MAVPEHDAHGITLPRSFDCRECPFLSDGLWAPAFKEVSAVKGASCTLPRRLSPLRSPSIVTVVTPAGMRNLLADTYQFGYQRAQALALGDLGAGLLDRAGNDAAVGLARHLSGQGPLRATP